MAASEVDAREVPSEDVGSVRKPFAAEASPVASEMRASKTVVGAETETVGPQTPAMSDEADGGDGYDVEEIKVPQAFIGRSLRDLNLRKNYEVSVLAAGPENRLSVNPPASHVLSEGDLLVVMGTVQALEGLPQL